MTATNLRDPALDPILDAILDTGILHLDLVHRCRLMDKINHSLKQRAILHKLYICDDKKNPVAYDFRPFTREDEALAAIVSTMEWSGRFYDFFSMNAKKFGQMMADEKPFTAFTEDFLRADRITQLKILKSMAARQLALFKHDGLTPQSPDIKITEQTADIAGHFNKGAWGLSLKVSDKTVSISQKVLEPGMTPDLCKTLWHEHVHSLCQQFAASCQAGILTVTNPFYGDAKIQRARMDNVTQISSTLPKAYAADPEEKIAYQTEEIFMNSWAKDSHWSTRLGRKLGF
ncbi:MAG: hypothetical protein JWO78_1028 [Micavibrio sp.]|nr:hypothetical protein [Micavibrio sp.]